MSRYPTTPLWLKLTVSLVMLAVTAWWVLDRTDRLGNEARLSAIASEIAGRAVHVHCPGPVGRVLGGSTAEGWVKFDAAGRPADETKLQKASCAELDALAEGRRAKELSCTERAGILCGRRGAQLAMAIDVVTHESFHMRGIRDEAATECASLHAMATTAQRLGATAAQGGALATGQFNETYPEMGEVYRSPDCKAPTLP
ncbi:MAG: hypothetical protein ABI611_19770 [Solirubrobacteraceae bacterium]